MLNPSMTTNYKIPDPMEAARHICEEARNVLSSLRSGPPNVARGELAQSLRDVRLLVKSKFLDTPSPVQNGLPPGSNDDVKTSTDTQDQSNEKERLVSDIPPSEEKENATDKKDNCERSISTSGSTVFIDHPGPPTPPAAPVALPPRVSLEAQVGPFVFPFLAVILDPRAAGPHTLVALRAIYRLLARKTFLVHPPMAGYPDEQFFIITLEPLVRGVLECRFEQTDAGADEAVEMAIADLLSLMVNLDYQKHDTERNLIQPDTLMEAFNTVFVTRNTFVHSPALCYHFEEVLNGIVAAVFGDQMKSKATAEAARRIMEFLVNQLLHTPLLETDGRMDGGGAEAHALHDATRLLCLRLIQSCLRIGWAECALDFNAKENDEEYEYKDEEEVRRIGKQDNDEKDIDEIKESIDERACSNHSNVVLRIVQDDLCLSLLMIGQSIWAYQDRSSQSLQGIISTQVLSEICSIFSTLWNISSLRRVLSTQFENIFTGFYQRALSLLRKLPIPNDSITFHSNHIFDAEVEIILESLVDILCLHDGSTPGRNRSDTERDGGTIEKIFLAYDCNLTRSDVSSGLLVELCRCCGGTVNEDGVRLQEHIAGPTQTDMTAGNNTERQSSEDSSGTQGYESLVNVRHVPAHLRELCAEALVGSVKSLFYEDPSPQTYLSDAKTTAKELSVSVTDVKSLRLAQLTKRKLRQAAKLFNKKPSKGIEYLVTSGILTSPVTPNDVVNFLRNGIVLGLDKTKVGEYLGEVGKPPATGGSPPCWDRDYFHKETLQTYCSSFHFENQSILDGLRMFLAAFRLPGEAQQIDRILQAFAETCCEQCLESQEGGLRLFRSDPKKASDGTYLLTFSIILLNTDLHNANIRADRKMSIDAFLRNNTNYGREITDPGCELPKAYLEEIYERIREEPIRTEGEGADGVMTLERWKDVLRLGDTSNSTYQLDYVDARELIVERMWMPVLSAIGGFWGVTKVGEPSEFYHLKSAAGVPNNRSGMLGAQGARLGMDLSVAMLTSLRNLSCIDIFHNFFHQICMYTGLLREYKSDGVERTASFINSVERQSAVIIILNTAVECGGLLGSNGWKMVWGILFELRDLKLLGGGTNCKHRSLIMESDLDLLCIDSRRDWSMRLVKECHRACGKTEKSKFDSEKSSSGIFSAVGRAIFGGSDNDLDAPLLSPSSDEDNSASSKMKYPSRHGKEELILWDDLAASDVEDEVETSNNRNYMINAGSGTVGNTFENHLIQEDNNNLEPAPPITGLETYEDTRIYQISPRARVRKRLSRICNFSALISETRFLDIESVQTLVAALACVIQDSNWLDSDGKVAGGDDTTECRDPGVAISQLILSPASEAFAEVLLCEIALKNRDRIGILWSTVLKDHYFGRLKKNATPETNVSSPEVTQLMEPGIEKCLTGLLRICCHTVHRDDVNEEVLQSLKILYSSEESQPNTEIYNFDKQLAEGAWRICCDGVDGLRSVGTNGWQGILGLIKYCAKRGEPLVIRDGYKSNSLKDDDPAFKAFRCLHLILNSEDLRNTVPFNIVSCIQALITAGERQNCPKLSIAGLDLLAILHARLQPPLSIICTPESEGKQIEYDESLCNNWFPVIEGMALASASRYASVRQHSIAMLTDALVDRHGQNIPYDKFCLLFSEICIPTARKRIFELLHDNNSLKCEQDEIMIELELCISITFKPFIHHMNRLILQPKELTTIWMSIIDIVSQILVKEVNMVENVTIENQSDETHILSVTKELASEHLRNAIMVLASNGIFEGSSTGKNKDCTEEGDDIESLTWNTVEKISYCKKFIPAWKSCAQK